MARVWVNLGVGGVATPVPRPAPSGAHERRPYRGVLASVWVKLGVGGVAAPGPRPTVDTGSESGKTIEGVR